jgi:hypothetical protein
LESELGLGTWKPGGGLGGFLFSIERRIPGDLQFVHNIINGCWLILGQALKDVTYRIVTTFGDLCVNFPHVCDICQAK